MKHILIVDDARGARESLKAVFTSSYRVSTAEDAQTALKTLHQDPADLVFLDIIMPGIDGLQLLGEILRLYPDMPVIMVSAATGVRPAIEAVRMGAFDYVSKPFDLDELRALAARALQSSRLKRRVAVLQGELNQEFPINGIIGESPHLRKALADIRRAADSDASVLLIGESGTGKELLARYLHHLSSRRDEPFCTLSCSALSDHLAEGELFGQRQLAMNGVEHHLPGLIDTAASGTLFLDEVGQLQPALQEKLQQVLQRGEFLRAGSTTPIPIRARVVAASSRDLRADMEAGRFRSDLFYQLGVVPIHLPPLRDRVDDIPLLTYSYLASLRQKLNVATRDVEPAALDLLRRYTWPGNIRELRNVIERTLVLHGADSCLRARFLPDEFHNPDRPRSIDGVSLTEAVNQFECDLIRQALEATGGVQTQAAERLGITRRMLKYRMDRLGLSGDRPD